MTDRMDTNDFTPLLDGATKIHPVHDDGPKYQSDDDDLADASVKNSTRRTQMATNHAFVGGSIVMAWLLGAFGFSMAWVLILITAIHVIWWSSLARLVEENVHYEMLKVRRVKAVHSDESAEWLNFIVNRWWAQSSGSVFLRAKALLEPMLNSSKPSFLDSVAIKELTLDNQTPSISAIKAFEVINGHRREMALNSVANLAGLQSIRYRVVIEADVDLACPNFKMVLGLLSGKVMAVDFVVTKLFLKGRFQVTLQFSAEAKFPHVSKATFMFLQKPKVQFDADQKILRSSLKTWANNLFRNVLTDSMVDPFRLEIDLGPEDNFVPAKESNNKLAKGVLTVTLSLHRKSGKSSSTQGTEDERWCTLKVGDQKHKTSCLPYRYSFLIESLSEDVLVIKVKANRFIGTYTLETFREPLAAIAQEGNDSVERSLSRGSVNLFLTMDYVSLAPPKLLQTRSTFAKMNGPTEFQNGFPNVDKGDETDEQDSVDSNKEAVVAGVLYICIHEAESLGSGNKKETCNPYCVVIYKGKKVKKTHFVAQTSKPSWETEVELLVSDYTQVSFSVAVCNWDTSKMIESDFFGLASVTMASGKKKIIRQQFRLDQSANQCDVGSDSLAPSITISVVFRPVPSVACSGVLLQEDTCAQPYGSEEEVGSSISFIKKTSVPLVSNTKQLLLSTTEPERILDDIPSTLASGHGLMEITILKAIDLVAKDFNGYSDPYCEVKLNQDTKYKTNVKKKTLQPMWNEKVIMQLPKSEDIVSVLVWDHDVFSRKDYLGSVSLSLEDIQNASTKEAGEWFQLRETTSGSIHIKFRIVSEGLENAEIRFPGTEEPRPKTPILELSQSSQPINFYGEGSLGENVEIDADLATTSTPTNETDTIPTMPLKIRTIIQNGASSNSRFQTSSSTGSSPQLSIRSLTAQSTSSSYSAGITMPQIRRDNSASNPSSYPLQIQNPKVPAPSPPERKSSLPSTSSQGDIIMISTDNTSTTTTEEPSKTTTSPLTRGSAAYASLHNVKRKMKKSFSQQLRRFRSEVNVHEEKPKNFKERVAIENRDDTYASCGQIDNLGTETDTSPNGDTEEVTEVSIKRTHFFNVQGTVIQATGLDAPKTSHISCRVRLLPCATTGRNAKMAAKTIAKTKLISSSPNPAFNLGFQADPAGGLPVSYSLVFEIRTANKETLTSKSITLQELFHDVTNESNEARACLCLNSGATLEVTASHSGNEIEGQNGGTSPQRKVSKLLRSWSIHRIGKI